MLQVADLNQDGVLDLQELSASRRSVERCVEPVGFLVFSLVLARAASFVAVLYLQADPKRRIFKKTKTECNESTKYTSFL